MTAQTSPVPTIDLISPDSRARIDGWIAKYPPERKQAAVMAALLIVQEQNGGWLTTELMDAVAEYLEMPPIAVYEVATFYTLYDLEPVGRHKIYVCTNANSPSRRPNALRHAAAHPCLWSMVCTMKT
jgi:NADH-quinone oxidoreductase subunit E